MEKDGFRFRDIGSLLKETIIKWNNDDAFTHAAAVSFYALISLPGILIIIVNTMGIFLGKKVIEGDIAEKINMFMGKDTAKQIQQIIVNASQQPSSDILVIVGIGVLMVSATGVFIQLQTSLNQVWQVKVKKEAGWIKILRDRAESFSLILIVGLLLFLSIILSSVVSSISSFLTLIIPGFSIYIFYLFDFIISFSIQTILFAFIFKYLPDIKIKFNALWVGAFLTTILFYLGKICLNMYFNKVSPESVFGAAGSIILILLWIYYSCLLLLFGAEFTQVYVKRYNYTIMPSSMAYSLPQVKEE
ncbi:MAG: YihY/virulence factor BrkB family protein [Sporocytophaga sp.]|uniref:YihY/virulence factor BrkB family protein n=1 Tax=Sporocytophaga sp. TaxID=2231183 RepID=UPI001B1F4B3E|nr:YihY/virulence factor BrkB family protein [Sporocytophaga sp.]MBO9699325.1 YihY/virulence factor BrkB family protein [Sporocytophaga sp.]